MNLWGNQIFLIFQNGPKLITRQLITRTCAYQGVRNVRFSETTVLRFALLPYCRRNVGKVGINLRPVLLPLFSK